MKIIEISVKSALQISGLKELDYSLNPYLGCFHRCLYCYAMDLTKDKRATDDWGSTIIVKKNIIEVLKKEVTNKQRGVVGISSITDPYQPVESEYRITRKSVEILLHEGFRVSIQTKSPLVMRDIDLFQKYKKRIDVGMTITTPSFSKARMIEVQSPAPEARYRSLKILSEKGIQTWVFYGPVIGGFNDGEEDIKGIAKIASETNSRVIYDAFSYYPSAAALMKANGITPAVPDMKKFSEKIQNICNIFNVECHSESEDYINEMNRINRKLF
ncbi:MAG: radical SAM protein [Thermoplasmata archaeon]